MNTMLRAARYRSRAYTMFPDRESTLPMHKGERVFYMTNPSEEEPNAGAFWIFLVFIAGIFAAITALLWWN